MLKRLGGLMVAAAAAGALMVTGPGTAAADPGACGVRHAGPDQGMDMWMIYTVHNKCGYVINVRVVVHGQWTGCADIEPYGNRGYLSLRASNDWWVQTC